jgi:hypothetical protein
MSSSPLTPEALGPQIVSYLDWLVESAEQAEGTAELGPVIEDICVHYRALAICMFADDGNVDDLFHWLLHSPLARKHYLVTVHGQMLGEPRYARASFVDPVLDAVAARQWSLAAEISAFESSTWLEGEEYEDDFCYGAFLRCAITGSPTDAVLGQWKRALEGGRDHRLAVAEALQSKAGTEFEQALRALLRANEAKARAMADPKNPSVLAEDFPFAPNRWMSIEGLALLALAERAGLLTHYELEGCPASARAASYAPFRSRAYPNLRL